MTSARPISIAIAALGGQGGGVLAQWIVDLAETNGYRAQYTSVPGVAQRTGATIYFIEIFPESAIAPGKTPILALMPAPGDVDVVIAAELMEAGRSIARGFVSPDFTTLIASDHRVYAISEKEILGDGRGDEDIVRKAAVEAAKSLILFDMNRVAEETGTVISSVLFGALAGSGALPFARHSYEDMIRATGKAVDANLKAFARAYDEAQKKHIAQTPAFTPSTSHYSADTQAIIGHSIARLQDYQDQAYADLYLERLDNLAQTVQNAPDDHLIRETARYLALWMSFEDVIRVADLKTRAGRTEVIRKEVRANDDQIFHVVEFFHPRFEEFCDSLPAGLGARLKRSRRAKQLLSGFFSKGRTIATNRLSGFIPLYILACFKPFRRVTLRFKNENARIEHWLGLLTDLAPMHYQLAAELAECPRLIKGYGDTHERGLARFEQILANLEPLKQREDGVEILRALREAALKDEEGCAFQSELARVAA